MECHAANTCYCKWIYIYNILQYTYCLCHILFIPYIPFRKESISSVLSTACLFIRFILSVILLVRLQDILPVYSILCLPCLEAFYSLEATSYTGLCSLLLWFHCSHIYIKWLFTVPGFAIRLLWNTEFYCTSAWIQSKIIFSYILISVQNYTLLYVDKCQKCSHSLVALNSTAVRENVVLQGSVNVLASSVLWSVWFCLSSFSSLFLKTTGFLCEPGEQFHTIASPSLHQAVAYIRPVSYLLHQVLRCIKQHITNCESKR